MEPRISSLIGDPTSSFLLDPPLFAQSNHADHGQPRLNDVLPPLQLPNPTRSTGRTLPLTEVLNFDSDGNKGTNGESGGGVGGFSGRLGDILLDGDVGSVVPRKRRRIEAGNASISITSLPPLGIENTSVGMARLGDFVASHVHDNDGNHTASNSAMIGGSMPSVLNNELMLPKPHPPPAKKKGRRPRILPPLLQGLHQPPPDAKMFPPITGERAVASPRIADGTEERIFPEAVIVGDRRDDRASQATSGQKGKGAEVERKTLEKQPDAARLKHKDKTGLNKRNKWTPDETRDLLLGVSRFGIGSWKKIFDCEEYTFKDRTCVDLKDRFRTCCPDEYIKFRASGKTKGKNKSKPCAISSKASTETLELPKSSPLGSPTSKPPRKPRSGTHRKGAQELAEMGIDKPFEKSKRRERHEFTEEDDNALMRGFEKYGPVWQAIKADPQLGFHARQPTDLRDRFRIRYPETYKKAGFKLKPKGEKKPKDAITEAQVAAKKSTAGNDTLDKTSSNPDSSANAQISLPNSTAPLAVPRLLAPIQTAFPNPFDDFTSGLPGDSEADDDAAYSPITLSRNILQFQWGDTNPTYSSTTTGSSSINATTGITSQLNFHQLGGMDQIHIDPRATLKLPPASSAASMYPAFSTTVPTANTSIASLVHSSYGIGGKAQQGQTYTTNLPTLVFPAATQNPSRASGSNVNLPPPADLLSGLDLDGRINMGLGMDTQSSHFLWDDGFATSGYDTHSGNGGLPTMGNSGTAVGKSGLSGSGTSQVRGMFESDGLGERSLLNSSI